jgi:hypothetical protein
MSSWLGRLTSSGSWKMLQMCDFASGRYPNSTSVVTFNRSHRDSQELCAPVDKNVCHTIARKMLCSKVLTS